MIVVISLFFINVQRVIADKEEIKLQVKIVKKNNETIFFIDEDNEMEEDNEIVEVKDVFCVYKNNITDRDCKFVYLTEQALKKDVILTSNTQLVLHPNNKMTNKTLQSIYINWIDTYFVNKNKEIILTIYEDDNYIIEEF